MNTLLRTGLLIVVACFVFSACGRNQNDRTAPEISDISTSGKVLVISDCPATSVTITTRVQDASEVAHVVLWYRLGSDQPFASIPMQVEEGLYAASVEGSDLQGNGYGSLQFYITAEDSSGNSSKSPLDTSIQFLPCVNN